MINLSKRYPNVEVSGTPDKSRYCYIEYRVHGFFACMYCIWYGFYICEMENLKGVVLMGEDHLYYDEQHGDNVFNYFFQQKAIVGISMTIKVINLDPFLKWCHISLFDKRRANAVITERLFLKPIFKKNIENFRIKYFTGGNILGVHYRGRDKCSETLSFLLNVISKKLTRF